MNSLKYLFSDHKLNIKDLILDNDISFDRIIVYLTATKGKKKLLEYPHQGNSVDLGGDLYNVESEKCTKIKIVNPYLILALETPSLDFFRNSLLIFQIKKCLKPLSNRVCRDL